MDPENGGLPVKMFSVNGIPITQQISRCLIQPTSLLKLPRSPSRGRMRRHVDVKYPPPIVAQNDQDEENPEGCGRNCEEIECDNFLAVIVEKCPPGLRWWPTPLDHVLGDRGL